MYCSKKRNVKFPITITEDLMDQIRAHNKTSNDLSNQIFKDINTGCISAIHVRGGGDKKDLIYDGKPTTKSALKDIYSPIFEQNGWAPKIEAFRTDTLEHILNRYQGYIKRNKTASELIKFKLKDIHYKGPFVKDDGCSLYFTTPAGSFSNSVDYNTQSGTLVNKAHLKKAKFGGNLNIQQGMFVAAVEIPYEVAYEPEGWIGTDINKRNEFWLVVGSAVHAKPDKIATLEKAISEVQVEINKPKGRRYKTDNHYKSSQRRGLRRRWEKLHRKHARLITKYLNPIIQDVEDNHNGLVIDGVTTGAQNGSFGQDKIGKHLIAQCENRRIPFYVPPTSYTSQRCAKCGHIEKKNRKNADEFKCQQCEHEAQPDLNAVQNYQFIGETLHYKGHAFGYYGTSRSKDPRMVKYDDIKSIFNI